jgi:hypothetical protein
MAVIKALEMRTRTVVDRARAIARAHRIEGEA